MDNPGYSPQLQIFNFHMFAKSLVPCKMTFTGTGGWDMAIFGGEKGIIWLSIVPHAGMWSYKSVRAQRKVENNFSGNQKRDNPLISFSILSPEVRSKSFFSPTWDKRSRKTNQKREDVSPRA